jgi:hypothetical protein
VLARPYFDPSTEVYELRVIMVDPAFRCTALVIKDEVMELGYEIDQERCEFNRRRNELFRLHQLLLHIQDPTGASVGSVWIFNCGAENCPATEEMIQLAKDRQGSDSDDADDENTTESSGSDGGEAEQEDARERRNKTSGAISPSQDSGDSLAASDAASVVTTLRRLDFADT